MGVKIRLSGTIGSNRNETIEKRDRQIELLLERLELLRHQRFGPKADRISKDQLALFDEAELNVLLEELDTQIAEAKAPPRSERSDVDPAHAGGVYCKGSGVSAGEGAGQSGFCSPGRIGAGFGFLKKFYLSYSGYDFHDQLKLTIL